MRARITLRLAAACGACGVALPVGAEAVEVSNGRGWRLLRCVACAGPVAVTDRVVPAASAPAFAGRVAELAARYRAGRDWKIAQGGE